LVTTSEVKKQLIVDRGMQESMDSAEKAVTSLYIPLPYDPLIKQRGLPCSHPPSGERGFFICKGF